MPAIKRNLQRDRGVSIWAWGLLGVMVAAIAVAVFLVLSLKKSDVTEKLSTAWVILKSEKMSFITTRRQEWQARIGSSKAAWYGIEESQGTVSADVFYGFDMSQLTQDDVTVEADGMVVIKMPPIQIQTVSLKPETYEAVTKRTGLMKLKTMMDDGDEEVQKRLKALKHGVLMDMFQNQHLEAKDMEEGVRDVLDPIFQKQGIPYRLEFRNDSPNKAILQYMKQENLS